MDGGVDEDEYGSEEEYEDDYDALGIREEEEPEDDEGSGDEDDGADGQDGDDREELFDETLDPFDLLEKGIQFTEVEDGDQHHGRRWNMLSSYVLSIGHAVGASMASPSSM